MAPILSHFLPAKRQRRLPPLSPVPELVDLASDDDSRELPTPAVKTLSSADSQWTSARVVAPFPSSPSSMQPRAKGVRTLSCRVCHIRFSSLPQFAEHRRGLCRGFLPAVPVSSEPKDASLQPIIVTKESQLTASRKRPRTYPAPSGPKATLASAQQPVGQRPQGGKAEAELAEALQHLLELPSPMQIFSSVCSAFGQGLKPSASSTQLPKCQQDLARNTDHLSLLTLSPSNGTLGSQQLERIPPLESASSSDSESLSLESSSPSRCDLSLSPTHCGRSSPTPRTPRAAKLSSTRVTELFEQVHVMMGVLKGKLSRQQLSGRDMEVHDLRRCIGELVEALRQHLSLQRRGGVHGRVMMPRQTRVLARPWR